MPSDRPAGDGNSDAYGERAETYLRLLAEDALRPPAGDAPPSPAPAEAAADRVYRAANLLVDAGVITDTQAAWILLDLATALRARGRPEPPPVPPGLIRRVAAARPKRSAVPSAEWRVLPGPAPVPGAHLMALVLTPDRVLAPATLSFPPSAGIPDLQGMPWAGLTAADGTGTTYWITSATGSWAGSTWTGTILMRPAPPARAGWVKISSRNGFSLLIPIPDASPAPAVLPEPVSDSPGERLLTRHAEAVLASLPGGLPRPAVLPRPTGPDRPPGGGRFAPVEPGFTELTGTLEAAGALSALSPVSRQVAALHTLLGLPDGAEVSNGSLSDLPGRWLHVVTHYGRRKQLPPASGTATIGAGLPDLDGARFAVAGLHSGPAGTHLHVVARGLRPLPHRVPPGFEGDTGFSWWLRDDSGGWHLGAIEEAIPVAAETVLRMAMLPPLTHRTATLTAEVTGRSTRVAAALPVRW
ncbi:MAG TPA: hypothetical protein VF060_24665 [Trebonia sp.]